MNGIGGILAVGTAATLVGMLGAGMPRSDGNNGVQIEKGQRGTRTCWVYDFDSSGQIVPNSGHSAPCLTVTKLARADTVGGTGGWVLLRLEGARTVVTINRTPKGFRMQVEGPNEAARPAPAPAR
jgi:hypothetical protein